MSIEYYLGTEKVPQRNCVAKIWPNFSGELSGVIYLKTLVLLGNDPVTPSNCSENSLVLFVRSLGFAGPFRLLKYGDSGSFYAFCGRVSLQALRQRTQSARCSVGSVLLALNTNSGRGRCCYSIPDRGTLCH